MGKYFGTDGVRGVAGADLTCELAMKIGRGAAAVLTGSTGHRPRILIGKDTRQSGDMLEAALTAGLCSVGADVESLGVLPTPAVAYLVGKYNADAGIVISASHNPMEFNGIKIFAGTGYKLPDEVENQIEAYIDNDCAGIELKTGAEVGRVYRRDDGLQDYVDHLCESIHGDLTGLKVCIDCANGASAAVAQKLFPRLGAKCTFLGIAPDGQNINKGVGSTHLENLEKAVVELLPHRESITQRAGIVPLQGQNRHHAKNDQPSGHSQHQFGVQGELAPAKVRMKAFQNDRKTQTTQHNECCQRQENHRLALKMRKASISAEEVKTRVAKRADRCEQALPHAARRTVERDETGHKQRGARQFHYQRNQKKRQRQPHHAAQGILVHGVAQNHTVPERDAPAQNHHDQRGEGHEAQSTHLDERKQNHLPEKGQLHPHIHDGQARNTYGGSGGEHRLTDAHSMAV